VLNKDLFIKIMQTAASVR